MYIPIIWNLQMEIQQSGISSSTKGLPQLFRLQRTGNWSWCGSTGMHWTAIHWKFRRGALDYAEEPGIVCAGRELEEETGYRCDSLEWLINIRTTVAFCNEKIEVFVARNLIPSHQHLDEDEYIELETYTVEELKEKIFRGEIEDSKTIASILAYDAKYCR